ncbi:cyclodeaminase/cyclohydrolase family protein [Adlercreutzia murintestinalis]|uniref:cyclodeaminase/cyclohydrolase family protein n=1 Tax=Adlercreutzia murintestinalis TaxID=2941325 RepID=UPI00203AE5FE|nr:cyclodeaminase/cyclohydrolase family protein [Adlercreutzia murintestinalis]
MLDAAFIEDLASASPTPGGGGASACVGALAAALASMVGNLTANNAKYAAVHDEMRGLLDQLAAQRARLLHLIELDARAFTPISAAFKMPSDTPEQIATKDLAMQSALVQGCDVPLDIMRECAQVLEGCKVMARDGSRAALTDVGVAALFAKAAVQGAALNIHVNVGWMTDQALAVRYASQADHITREACQLADEIYLHVLESVKAGS